MSIRFPKNHPSSCAPVLHPPRTLDEAIKDADVFLGLSAKDVLTKDMVKSMAKNPIIFACANPDPEINPEDVLEVRDDVIMAGYIN